MHEYSIVQALISRVEQEASTYRASSVARLHVRIGSASGVEPVLLATAYDTFKQHTVCDTAQLVIDRVEERWACPLCGQETGPGASLFCKTCAVPMRLVSGDEIILARIEMEVA